MILIWAGTKESRNGIAGEGVGKNEFIELKRYEDRFNWEMIGRTEIVKMGVTVIYSGHGLRWQ